MNNTYTTKYAIGDTAYTASESKVDKDVIKAIKISTLKKRVEYGFSWSRTSGIMSFYWYGDDYRWLSEKEIFTDEESAERYHQKLKAERKAKDAQEAAERIQQRKRELEEELRELGEGENS